MVALRELEVVFVDVQATAAQPARGALLEVGWARGSATGGAELSPGSVVAYLVAPPAGATRRRPEGRRGGTRRAP